MSEKLKINLSKSEVKKEVKKIEESDYFTSLREQIKRIKSGQFNETFRGHAEKWQKIIHGTEFQISDVFKEYLVPGVFSVGDLQIAKIPSVMSGKDVSESKSSEKQIQKQKSGEKPTKQEKRTDIKIPEKVESEELTEIKPKESVKESKQKKTKKPRKKKKAKTTRPKKTKNKKSKKIKAKRTKTKRKKSLKTKKTKTKSKPD
ncbi:MAG: hypothetical protein ACTSSI_15445 [Candidatus Helarchaeota archaeon]